MRSKIDYSQSSQRTSQDGGNKKSLLTSAPRSMLWNANSRS